MSAYLTSLSPHFVTLQIALALLAPTRGDEDVPEGEAASVVVDDLSDAQREAVPPQEDGQREGGLALDDSLRWRGAMLQKGQAKQV